MISLNYLPELVVHHILKYAIKNAYMFKRQLPYLAVCHTWRHVALPLVYRKAYANNGTHSHPAKWRSNIDLLLSSGYSMFVKHLDIEYRFYVNREAVKELESFLNALDIGPVQLPAGHQQKFVSSNGENERQHHRNETPVIMDEDFLQMVQKSVNKFAQKFPRIKSLELHETTEYSLPRQIYALLVNAFADQLRSLVSTYLYVKDLACSLDILTSFTYTCDNSLHLLLPKVNILPLEKLHIYNAPDDFSWGVLPKEPNRDEPVIFPKLKDLGLTFKPISSSDLSQGTPDNTVRVQLPNLQNLTYSNYKGLFVFQPEIIPSRLDSVDLDVTGDAFVGFSKLLIESIDSLSVGISREPSDMSEFCIAANHFFNDIKNAGRTVVEFCHHIHEIGRIGWRNVNHIRLVGSCTQDMVYAINSMPQITNMHIRGLYLADLEYWPVVNPGFSKLEKIYIWYSDTYYWKSASNQIIEMLKSLECLRKLEVKRCMAEYIREKVRKLVEDYPWFEDLEIGMG